MKATITEVKNTLKGTNSRLDEAEDRISNLKDKKAPDQKSKQEKEFKKMRIV